MPCNKPVSCWRYLYPNSGGTRPLIHSEKERESLFSNGISSYATSRPCGYCVGCRLDKSRQIAIRCVHQASLHDDNCFLTLTYRDDCVPDRNSIYYPHLRDFWKRLRDRLGYPDLKYYSAGEYGDVLKRPHYHACVFGYKPSDLKFYTRNDRGDSIFTSQFLEGVWSFGRVWIGSVTFDSAAYVARYTMKKIYGRQGAAHYAALDVDPEKSWSSKGLGKEWFERYRGDIYPKDYFTFRGVKVRPPAYYDRLLLRDDPDLIAELKAEREDFVNKNSSKINVDIRYEDVHTSVLLAGVKVQFAGKLPTTVSEMVHQASLRSGRLDVKRS